jgi:hypothetical protein
MSVVGIASSSVVEMLTLVVASSVVDILFVVNGTSVVAMSGALVDTVVASPVSSSLLVVKLTVTKDVFSVVVSISIDV